jgi:hypothetical protein
MSTAGAYTFELPGYGITFEADRLRRDHQELFGELIVRCTLPGAKAVNGALSTGDFNFSSVRARSDRAKLLKERARTNGDVDWFGLLEEFVQRVFESERLGDPAVDLRDLPRPVADDVIRVEGLSFPLRHPSILFGDGGTAKSYTALYVLGTLALRGLQVGMFDWELSGDDHRERLERLFGPTMPRILYARCERPLTAEADRLRRLVKEHALDFVVFDSVAFACDGPPEAAEIAGRYFRAVREINCGSLHIAHVTKSENADQRPFGSAFWHNGARSTWNVQAADPDSNGSLRLAFFNRKSNLGRLASPASLSVDFTADDRTIFRIAEIADDPDFAEKMSIRQRIVHILRRGARTPEEIASSLDANVETVRRTIRRYKQDFTAIDGGLIGLLGRAS